MNLRHDNHEKSNSLNPENIHSNEKKRKFAFFKDAAESLGRKMKILAFAVSTTVIAYGCLSTSGRYMQSDTDVQTDVANGDTETDIAPDVPDAATDETEDSDVYDAVDTSEDAIDDEIEEFNVESDASEDIIEDETEVEDSISEDVLEEDAIGDVLEEDVIEEDPPEPVCFTIPSPIDPATEFQYNNSTLQDTVFHGSGAETITTDLETSVSMFVLTSPSVSLGVCPDNPNAYAFIENPGKVLHFLADVSMEAGGSSWSATVPEIPGMLCPALIPDSGTLVAHNSVHRQIPKNADMAGTITQAGFDLMPVISTLVAYEKNGSIESYGELTIGGAGFAEANTIKAVVLDGNVDIEVETRAGDTSDFNTYIATILGTSSKEARIYATAGDQMYGVDWDTSNHYFCSRCTEYREFDIVISGDLLCKIFDSCGCVGDGFDISILGVSIDRSFAPTHLENMVQEASPTVRSAGGVSAFFDPSTDHPSISIRLRRGTVSFDDGVRANFYLNINVEFTSENQNPDGTYDTRTVTVRVPVVDPWTFGSLEPNYSTVCPAPCTLSY